MMSVREFWIRVGVGGVLLVLGLIVAGAGNPAGLFLLPFGVLIAGHAAFDARRQVNRARKLERERRRD